jgi:hypothetical protein
MNITTIIGIVLLSAFIIPVIIVMQKQKREKKRLEKYLSELASEKNIKITRHETWTNKLIGIDDLSGNAVMIQHDADNYQVSVVDLHHITRCEAEKSYTVSETDPSVQAVKQVRIRFTARGKGQRDQTIVLFDEDTDQNLGTEIRIANTWADHFNQFIRKILKAA